MRKHGLYYSYRNVNTQKLTALGYDKKKAIAIALQCNTVLVPNYKTVINVSSQILGTSNTFSNYCNYYIESIIPTLKRSTGYNNQDIARARKIQKAFAGYAISTVTQAELAHYLKGTGKASTFNAHRKTLKAIFKHLLSDGLVDANLPDNILAADEGDVKRQRLSLDGYKAIFAVADITTQNLMELGLNFMARRDDLRKMKFSQYIDGYLHYKIHKSKQGRENLVRVNAAIPAVYSGFGCETLGDIIDHCRDNVASPYLVHRRPTRIIAAKETTREHWTQLSLKQASTSFQAAREASGYYNHLNFGESPSLHELVALGEHLRSTCHQWTLSEIQQFRGHSSQKSTRRYLDGHDYVTIDLPLAK